ncbi:MULTISPECIES: LamB/YcsF family protein [Cohaesibacter]|uniref:LamB/YcsF family protein n=1 Tax=Cohaesibacter TaxID=655352 RepID=UPI000DE9603F|nr:MULTISPECIES: 5-oxoprolinase subunit PxpA [Cohaesibacter]TLP48228.1 LamB/YcsF family protein [Cohaesibacter sp. CAU 1516]
MHVVDLNADLGESFGAYTIGDDGAMLDIISSANVACGFHGGDALVMHDTLALAKEKGVAIGAHPGFQDLWGFGRRPIQGEKPSDIEKQLVYQLGAILGVAKAVGVSVGHFKVHGALNNMACVDADLAMATARALKSVDPDLIYLVMPGSEMEKAGEKLGLNIAREIFADRAYEDTGMLVSRKLPGAMIEDTDEAARRMVDFVTNGIVESVNGKRMPVAIDSICVHGDNPHAVATARKVRAALEAAGVTIRPMVESLRAG